MTITLLSLLALPLAVLSQQTQVLFIDGQPGEQFAASVVSQDACGTTLNLVCTGGTASLPAGYGAVTCDPSGFESNFASAAATYSGNSIYEVSQSFVILSNGGIQMQVKETCSIYGATSAICSGLASVSTAGIETQVPYVTTLLEAEVNDKLFTVPFTAGSVTMNTAACATPAPFTTPVAVATSGVGYGSSSYATASTSYREVSGAGRRRLEVRKIVVVPGAAALLAGAALL